MKATDWRDSCWWCLLGSVSDVGDVEKDVTDASFDIEVIQESNCDGRLRARVLLFQ